MTLLDQGPRGGSRPKFPRTEKPSRISWGPPGPRRRSAKAVDRSVIQDAWDEKEEEMRGDHENLSPNVIQSQDLSTRWQQINKENVQLRH
ncbi:hypothetical protein AAFF_G00209990 [Aldrovandia affinis]|uniref:Uncharacterized protein n=1 Tax=Aldrovandia affinis TaxID=143900 RepID=A0AAD7SWI7_9TELE|nr:hypothetical protein AAFF_G00209990 [Aldrovandia affinis]